MPAFIAFGVQSLFALAGRMLHLLYFSLLLTSWHILKLPDFIASFSVNLRNICETHIPSSSYQAFNQALVCGSNPAPSPDLVLIKNFGLIHILVVSGSHLVLLLYGADILILKRHDRFNLNHKFVEIILVSFTLMTGLQPPCVRSLVQNRISSINRRFNLNWSSMTIVLLSGLICLLLFPTWVSSISLLLSWGCGIAVELARNNQNSVLKQAAIYSIVFTICLPLGSPHPITIFSNLLLAPVMGGFLFPTAALSCLFPRLSTFLDGVWTFILELLSQISNLTCTLSPVKLHFFWQWTTIVSVHIFCRFRELRRPWPSQDSYLS